MPTTLEPLLRRHPFCRDMPDDAIALMTGCAENLKFAPGERLFRAGASADRTFLIRSGRVGFELPASGGRPIETAEEGELVGWSWLFPPYAWHFDAVAVGPVRALSLDGACLRRKCEADPAFGYDLVKRILYQAQQRLERSRMQALDVFGGPR
ncbi:MAG: cyclic nucleotide-binding domain-containing protein [Alphaproteobacteria bacterium]|nr:cyclic nucleotide-binding domain-containing protein [Alphaproteobacteria bacterium]